MGVQQHVLGAAEEPGFHQHGEHAEPVVASRGCSPSARPLPMHNKVFKRNVSVVQQQPSVWTLDRKPSCRITFTVLA